MNTKSYFVRLGFVFLGVVLMVLGLGFFLSMPTIPAPNLRSTSIFSAHLRVTNKLLSNIAGQEVKVTVIPSESALLQTASKMQENPKIIISEADEPVRTAGSEDEKATLLTSTPADKQDNLVSFTNSLSKFVRSLAVFRRLAAEEVLLPQELEQQHENALDDQTVSGKDLSTEDLDNQQYYYYVVNDNLGNTYYYEDNSGNDLDYDADEDDDQPYEDDDGDENDIVPIDDEGRKEVAGGDLQNGDGLGMLFLEVNS